jgi:hypothetical protein
MDSSCEQCSAGPAGIAGHPKLWVRSLNGSEMIFQCEGCQTLWTRSGKPERYDWAAVNDTAATGKSSVSVPPRAEPLAPFAWRRMGPVRPVAADRS